MQITDTDAKYILLFIECSIFYMYFNYFVKYVENWFGYEKC